MDYTTSNGTITIVYQMTLGEIVIAATLGLILIFLVLKWVLETVWRQ